MVSESNDSGNKQAAAAATPAPPSLSVWERLKEHKIAQWTLAYAAAGYALLHGTEMVSNALEWPFYHALHRKHDSDAALARLQAEHGQDLAMFIAEAYAYRGQSDLAFKWLDKAYAQNDPNLWFFKARFFSTHSRPTSVTTRSCAR